MSSKRHNKIYLKELFKVTSQCKKIFILIFCIFLGMGIQFYLNPKNSYYQFSAVISLPIIKDPALSNIIYSHYVRYKMFPNTPNALLNNWNVVAHPSNPYIYYAFAEDYQTHYYVFLYLLNNGINNVNVQLQNIVKTYAPSYLKEKNSLSLTMSIISKPTMRLAHYQFAKWWRFFKFILFGICFGMIGSMAYNEFKNRTRFKQ